MPTGLGGYDAQGIWQYGEDDTETLMSDLLNKGQASVSDQVEADRVRLDAVERFRTVIPSSVTNGSVSAAGVVTSTAQALVRVRDAFPTTWRVFRVTFDVTTSALVGLLMRLALNAADSSTGYDYQRMTAIAGAVSTAQDLNQGSGSLAPIGVAGRQVGEVLITNPNIAGPTFWDSSALVTTNPMTAASGRSAVAGQHRASTAYNSLALFGGSGNITINRLTIEGVS